MKKAFSLLLVLVMCLSLCTCGVANDASETGAYTESVTTTPPTHETTAPADTELQNTTVEITMDNWQEYLELDHMASWKLNAFDEVEGLFWVYPVLALKEEYRDNTISTNTEIAVEYTTTIVWRQVDADIASKTYTWGDEYLREENVKETAKYYSEGLFANSSITEQGGIVILNYIAKGENGISYPQFKNFSISRIEGAIVFE